MASHWQVSALAIASSMLWMPSSQARAQIPAPSGPIVLPLGVGQARISCSIGQLSVVATRPSPDTTPVSSGRFRMRGQHAAPGRLVRTTTHASLVSMGPGRVARALAAGETVTVEWTYASGPPTNLPLRAPNAARQINALLTACEIPLTDPNGDDDFIPLSLIDELERLNSLQWRELYPQLTPVEDLEALARPQVRPIGLYQVAGLRHGFFYLYHCSQEDDGPVDYYDLPICQEWRSRRSAYLRPSNQYLQYPYGLRDTIAISERQIRATPGGAAGHLGGGWLTDPNGSSGLVPPMETRVQRPGQSPGQSTARLPPPPPPRCAVPDQGPALPRAFSLVQHYPDGPTRGAVVVVRITTDVSGRVTQAAVVSNSGDTAYSDAALSAVRNQRIQPARRDCENVAGSGEVTVTFAPR